MRDQSLDNRMGLAVKRSHSGVAAAVMVARFNPMD